MIRVADYIAKALVLNGVKHVFMVTGGGAMHLNDAIGRCKGLEYFCCHHEQACAMAAESYARHSNRLGVVNVTTGPGGINTLNGVFGAWTDSIPMLVISGQVKRETCLAHYTLPGLRQLGDQETDIISMVKGITKYSVIVMDPQTIRYHLEKAVYLAMQGRPGPCWIDIPIDVQGSLIDPDSLPRFDPESEPNSLDQSKDLTEVAGQIFKKMQESERPVLMVGSGVGLSGARAEFIRLADRWKIPVVTAWNAHDLIWNEHPSYVGRPGTIGDRAGNFAVQNSDFLLVIGSRLNVRQISYNWKSFAREAYTVMVDIDAAELNKPTFAPDLAVQADAKKLIEALLSQAAPVEKKSHQDWLAWNLERKARYPVVRPVYWENTTAINPYCFVDTLFRILPENETVVCGDGTACVTAFQGAYLRPGQRLYTNSGSASMGYDLPGAIGASIASHRGKVVCLAGDGSIQMNLQELQTIITHQLPIKLFILNNQGYHSIRQTQRNYFPDNIVGCGTESGLGFPDFGKLVQAYGYPFRRCETHAQLEECLRATLEGDGPQVCEIMLDLNQQFEPKLASKKLADGRMVSSALEDLFPFLEEEELRRNMLIPVERG